MVGALDMKSAAVYLGITYGKLKAWVRMDIAPPYYRNGKGIYFRVASLDKWMRDKECA